MRLVRAALRSVAGRAESAFELCCLAAETFALFVAYWVFIHRSSVRHIKSETSLAENRHSIVSGQSRHDSLNNNSFTHVSAIFDKLTGGRNESFSSSLTVSLRRHPHILAFPFSESPHVLRQVMSAAESDRAKSHNKLRIPCLH